MAEPAGMEATPGRRDGPRPPHSLWGAGRSPAGQAGGPGPAAGAWPAGTTRRRLPAWVQHPSTAPVATVVAGLAASAYLYNTDPHQSGHWLPRCPFNWATGLLCPACGGTRLVYDLLHGDPVRAFHENALMFVVSPVALWAFGRWVVEGLRGRRWRPVLSARAQYVLITVAIAWTVVRNLR